MIRSFAATVFGACAVLALTAAAASAADPRLSLYQAGTTRSSATYTLQQLPTTLSIDVHLDTAGRPLDGLEFVLGLRSPTSATFTYAGAGTVGSPFAPGENQSAIAAGDPVNASSITSLFRAAAGNYAASSDYNVITYAINLSGVTAGDYVFSAYDPILTDSPNGFFTRTFAAPGDFTLTVSVPEPGTAAATALVAIVCFISRARRRILHRFEGSDVCS